MKVIKTVQLMQKTAMKLKRKGRRIVLVPTMGYLHNGHLSLIKKARKTAGANGVVVVSIYVNPTQFGPNEDLSRYPRDLKRDLDLIRPLNVDIVFNPSDKEMYPGKEEGLYSTYIVEENLSKNMEGSSRPGHFRGVATVVGKLFNIVMPDAAVFGEKDYQQAAIIKRMVKDFNFPLKIVVSPTVRESDGLAMSSRNSYLNESERKQATALFRAIQYAKNAVSKKGTINANDLKNELKNLIEKEPSGRVDYIEFFDPETLQPVSKVRSGAHLALAVYVGKTRLIDNASL